MMTVKEYLDRRVNGSRKKIRVIDPLRGGYGDWTLYADRQVLRVSASTKYLFIYVK